MIVLNKAAAKHDTRHAHKNLFQRQKPKRKASNSKGVVAVLSLYDETADTINNSEPIMKDLIHLNLTSPALWLWLAWLCDIWHLYDVIIDKHRDLVMKKLSPFEHRHAKVLTSKVDQKPKPSFQSANTALTPALILQKLSDPKSH